MDLVRECFCRSNRCEAQNTAQLQSFAPIDVARLQTEFGRRVRYIMGVLVGECILTLLYKPKVIT
jgi:hypothetical protein